MWLPRAGKLSPQTEYIMERFGLPMVDNDGKYLSLLHYRAFAQNILRKVNPRKKAIFPTSLNHLLKTLKAQPILLFDER